MVRESPSKPNPGNKLGSRHWKICLSRIKPVRDIRETTHAYKQKKAAWISQRVCNCPLSRAPRKANTLTQELSTRRPTQAQAGGGFRWPQVGSGEGFPGRRQGRFETLRGSYRAALKFCRE